MNSEKQIIYKPHVVYATLIMCTTVFLCIGCYFFFEYKKVDSKYNLEIKEYDLKIEKIEKELKENEKPVPVQEKEKAEE